VTLNPDPGVRCLTVGNGHEHGFNAGLLHLLEQPSSSEDLIVGVRSHDNEASWPPLLKWRERGKTSSTEPRLLVRPGVQVIDD
jgi:hypothetical protein